MYLWILLLIHTVFAQPLPELHINQNAITVSGISAGCYMAVQTHVAHSSLIKGMACTAGGPYWCAQNSIDTAITQCMTEQDAPYINLDYLQQSM